LAEFCIMIMSLFVHLTNYFIKQRKGASKMLRIISDVTLIRTTIKNSIWYLFAYSQPIPFSSKEHYGEKSKD
jgi:hypothetical protein